MKFFFKSFLILFFLWTVAISILLVWNISESRKSAVTLARNEAQIHVNKDLSLRMWASEHGGVYVTPDKRTPTNPYLSNMPDRDIVTIKGKHLTLMNPAYVLRQVMSEFRENFGVAGHITSLNPLNPLNTPDEWERKALESFQSGIETEVYGQYDMGGKPYYRYIYALITKESCLKCHKHQGYKVGDIRGGISVAVPMEKYIEISNANVRRIVILYLCVYILGISVLLIILKIRKRVVSESVKMNEALKKSESKYRTLLELSPSGLFRADTDSNLVYANKRWYEITEITETEASQQGWKKFIHDEDRETVLDKLKTGLLKKEPVSLDFRMEQSDGTVKWLILKANMEFNVSNEIIGHIGTFTDITQLKEAKMLRMQSTSLLMQHITNTLNHTLENELNNITLLRLYHGQDETHFNEKLDDIEKGYLKIKDFILKLNTLTDNENIRKNT